MSRLIKTALTQYGIEEWKGNIDNPEVIKYFDDIGFDGKTLKPNSTKSFTKFSRLSITL